MNQNICGSASALLSFHSSGGMSSSTPLDPTCRPHNLGRNPSNHCLNLVELTTDLLQGTQLGLIVDVVVTACLHRLYQALLELIVLGCCLTSCLSCSSFLLRCKAKLRPGVRKHVLVIFDLRLKCRLIHRIRLLRSLSLFTCTTFFPQRRVAQALIRASGAYLVTRTHTR